MQGLLVIFDFNSDTQGENGTFTFFIQKSCVQLWAFPPKTKDLDAVDLREVLAPSSVDVRMLCLTGVPEQAQER